MFARKFRSGKETFVELLFLPNFLYFRKSVLKKLRVQSRINYLCIFFPFSSCQDNNNNNNNNNISLL